MSCASSASDYERIIAAFEGRLSEEDWLMASAELASRRSTCLRGQVGAVIAIDGRIVSTGYNGAPPGFPHCTEVGCDDSSGDCLRTTHAEANAIAFAARKGQATEGGELWTTKAPCLTCAKGIIAAGITKVHYQWSGKEEGLELLWESTADTVRHGGDDA